jgi:hypothetical protein
MKKLTLKHCWLSTKSHKPLVITVRVPEEEQNKLFQWTPFEYSGFINSETGEVDVVTTGIPRDEEDHLILKRGGGKAQYSTRDGKGRKHPLGAVMNQYYKVTICLLPNGTIGLYSVEFELDPPLNKFGEVHIEPTRRSRAAVKPMTNLDEEQEEEYV